METCWTCGEDFEHEPIRSDLDNLDDCVFCSEYCLKNGEIDDIRETLMADSEYEEDRTVLIELLTKDLTLEQLHVVRAKFDEHLY